MPEPKILEVYVVVSCDRHAGEQIRGDFYTTVEAAKTEIDRIYEKWASDSPKYIEPLAETLSYRGFQVISRWGEWRRYSIRRIDRTDRLADDLKAEAIEGHKAKFGEV